ncbi:hypothetical protein TYRP_000071 [Tyrophagus putrescentiae]|nr:hypothetical protein TYRP_000071 [Tyrophagus putrescentiae]
MDRFKEIQIQYKKWLSSSSEEKRQSTEEGPEAACGHLSAGTDGNGPSHCEASCHSAAMRSDSSTLHHWIGVGAKDGQRQKEKNSHHLWANTAKEWCN